MTGGPFGVPRWVRRLLPPDVWGDLEEGFRRRRGAHGSGRRVLASAWYATELIRFLLRLPALRGTSGTGSPWRLHMVLHDAKYAVRSAARRPTLSAVVVVTLTLVIGATTTIFSLVNSLFFGSTQVHEPERVVEIYGSRDRDAFVGGFRGYLPLSFPNADDIRQGSTVLESAYAYTTWPVSIELGDRAERSQAMYVSSEYFEVLGIVPHLGRGFDAAEDDQPGAAPVAVVSHALWRNRLGGDPGALGSTFRLNARAYTIVGVAPAGFRGTSTTLGTDIWLPVSMIVDVPVWGDLWFSRGARFFFMGGRLRDGVTVGQAASELDAVWDRLAEAHPRLNAASGLQLLPLPEARVNPNVRGVVAGTSAVLMGVVGLLLLIACMNVANVLLARALGRGREMAIRTSVGAARSRLVAQLLTESVVLFGLGGLGGLGLAFWGQGALTGLQPPALFGATLNLETDVRVLAFTGLVTFGCAIVFGSIPAWRATRTEIAAQLRDGERGSSGRAHWLRNGLVAGQVALSLVALVGAGLFLKTLERASQVPLGFEPVGLELFSVDLGAQGYSEAEGRAYYREVLQAVDELPGVESAAIGSLRPLTFGPLRTVLGPDEDPEDPEAGTLIREHLVSPEYPATLELPLLGGRPLNSGDESGGVPVALVNERMAQLLWPGQDPQGGRFRVGVPPTEVTVVGIVADGKYATVSEDPAPAYFRPAEQEYTPTATIFVRIDPGGPTIDELQRTIQRVDPALPVFDVMSAERLVDQALWNERALALLLGAFGALGLVLAGVGIYGVVSNSVRERTREIGLRMALGADPPTVLFSLLSRVVLVACVGVAVGLLLAVALTGPLAPQLLGVSPRDPGTYAGTAGLLVAVAVAAAYLPARRATRIDPSRALGVE